MSKWNSLESQLRRWTPRQPSPELHARIFRPAAIAVDHAEVRLRDLSRWLVPALGCFMLVSATLSTRYPSHEGHLSGTNFALAALPADHSDINAVPTRRLELSLVTPSITPSLGSILVSYTNKLIQ